MRTLIILLVEDDIDDRENFIEATAKINLPLKCFTVSNVPQAIELLRDNYFLPDFIFLDLNLPGENGKMLLEKITEENLKKSIPIIVYTTSVSGTEKEECMRLGATKFITKPPSFLEIQKAIEEVVMEPA